MERRRERAEVHGNLCLYPREVMTPVPDPPVQSLLMYTSDEIDYEALSPTTLQALALEVDPFIATSALGELSIRDPGLAADAARTLLATTDDRYLLSSAASILLERDPESVLKALP